MGTVNSKLREFSQIIYGLMLALSVLEQEVQKTNFNQEKIFSAINRQLSEPSAIGTLQKLKKKALKPTDITLAKEHPKDIYEISKSGLINLLLVGLLTLLDECISIKFSSIKDENIYSKIEKLKSANTIEKWAVDAIEHLRTMRNDIVHNNEKNYLQNHIQASSPTTSPIKPTFEDIFRFRRAIRTFINQAKKI